MLINYLTCVQILTINSVKILRKFKKRVFPIPTGLFLFLILTPLIVFADEKEEQQAFNPGEMIMHHIADDYSWHFATIGNTHITIPLPVILYSNSGLDVFLSSKFQHEHATYKGYRLEKGHIIKEDGKKFYDISITKNVASMMLSALLLCLIFMSAAKRYKKNKNKAPKGLQSLLEPIIIFVRDEIAIPMLGSKHQKYLPYLLTVFFFIWLNNLLGLLPGAANLTGNIAVTMTLAVITFVITNFSGNKHYWAHIFMPPGVPGWLWPLMVLVEIVGIFTKPFALMIRLFANMTAGHMIILSIISLIFIFGQNNPWVGGAVSVVSVAFSVFMLCLELLVATLQAYIFTILSSLFISDAVAEPHKNS